jgi:hypothetical protein
MKCNSCSSSIPERRSQLGFNTCVNCSNVETYGFVNIINHKTGNTVQPLPRSQANAINKIGDRKRFGTVLKGGSKSTAYNPKNTKHKVPTVFIGNKFTFEMVGKKALSIVEEKSIEAAINYVEKEVRDYTINGAQALQIKKVINLLYGINE